MPLTLASPAFSQQGGIPTRYTCEGEDISPPLSWSDVPEGTQSFTLIVDDPDAPDPQAPRMTWVHWALYNLPATARALPEGMRSRGAARGHEGRTKRLETNWLRGSVSTDRSAPLLSQAVCAGHGSAGPAKANETAAGKGHGWARLGAS